MLDPSCGAAGAPDAQTAAHLQAAFAAACAEHAIDGALELHPDGLQARFDGQEGASPELMLGAFADELRKADVDPTHGLGPRRDLTATQADHLETALRWVVARMRTLLVEFNSYISGGLAWRFPAADQPIAAQGLAIYRFPARGAVDVLATETGVDVDVHAGDLGEVTSSGFYVPRWLRGDLTVELRYELRAWEPGAQAANFALFLQDEPSELRYYAQRRSSGAGPAELLGNYHNQHFTATVPAGTEATSGWLRLVRTGDEVTASFRRGCEDAYTSLGSHRGDPTNDLLPGAKIWSSGPCGRLRVHFDRLTVRGTLAPDPEQIPPVPLRPDPRSA